MASLGNAISSAWEATKNFVSDLGTGISNTFQKTVNLISGSGFNTNAEADAIKLAQINEARAQGYITEFDETDEERAYNTLSQIEREKFFRAMETGEGLTEAGIRDFLAKFAPPSNDLPATPRSSASASDGPAEQAKEVFILSNRQKAQEYVDGLPDGPAKDKAKAALDAEIAKWDENKKTKAGQQANKQLKAQYLQNALALDAVAMAQILKNYSDTKAGKTTEIDGIKIILSNSAEFSKYNTRKKIETTNGRLWRNLATAAKANDITAVYINTVNYGGEGSHGRGEALDIGFLYDKNGAKLPYHVEAGTTQPPLIKRFENDFWNLPGSYMVWGPWQMRGSDFGDNAWIRNPANGGDKTLSKPLIKAGKQHINHGHLAAHS